MAPRSRGQQAWLSPSRRKLAGGGGGQSTRPFCWPLSSMAFLPSSSTFSGQPSALAQVRKWLLRQIPAGELPPTSATAPRYPSSGSLVRAWLSSLASPTSAAQNSDPRVSEGEGLQHSGVTCASVHCVSADPKPGDAEGGCRSRGKAGGRPWALLVARQTHLPKAQRCEDGEFWGSGGHQAKGFPCEQCPGSQ